MADRIANTNGITARKRKTHRKSRLGCGNCKIRSVKVQSHALLVSLSFVPPPCLPFPVEYTVAHT
ncbi:uncharacterized protein TrAtP1_005308 [Trichoderma atroviride]|uniref:uncharacterized protein n=1 Tax=Hypocrea atroviridis TaxID=63577 RepID=UPI00332A6FAD|nr:hypothetical protein TrAtP1_005308 [Trichoderma atroviride]